MYIDYLSDIFIHQNYVRLIIYSNVFKLFLKIVFSFFQCENRYTDKWREEQAFYCQRTNF